VTRLPFSGLSARAWSRLATAGAYTALAVILLATAWAAYASGGQDFRGYYAAAKVVAQGGDPYDYQLVANELVRATGRAGNNPYYYPPWLAVMLAPLSLLPYETARLVWLAGCLGSFIILALLIRRCFDWPKAGWRTAIMAMSLIYPLAWIALRAEQVTLAVACLLPLAVWALARRRDVVCGVALALLLTKPNVTFLPLALLLIYVVGQRRWRVMAAFGTMTLALLALSAWFLPSLWQHLGQAGFGQGLWEGLDGPGVTSGQRINATLRDWLATFGLPPWTAIPAYVAAIAWAGWLAFASWKGRWSPALIGQRGVVAGFLITPYAMEYDYILMAVAVVALWRATLALRSWRLLAAAALWLAFYAFQPSIRWMSDAYWLPLILLALGIVSSVRRSGWSPSSRAKSNRGQPAIGGAAPSA
jgi:alpha-1,2-mannosyltransferase